MNLGIIGLGKMGYAIAHRVLTNGEVVYGFDVDKKTMHEAHSIGVQLVDNIVQLPQKTNLIWLMLPAGDIIDTILQQLIPHLEPQTIIIDGGNSNYKDSIRRADFLAKHQIDFLDCGTSGGLKGQDLGFSLMIGGKKEVYEKVAPLLKTIAAKDGYGLVGPSGAGHYVKMIHNGIEYALLQGYAEGFNIIKDGFYKQEHLDLALISTIWQHGSIIRSYILELAHEIFKEDQLLADVSGYIGENGTGQWALHEAQEHHLETPAIKEALRIRAESRETGGTYATKIIALLRHKFGGHVIKKEL